MKKTVFFGLIALIIFLSGCMFGPSDNTLPGTQAIRAQCAGYSIEECTGSKVSGPTQNTIGDCYWDKYNNRCDAENFREV